MSHSFKFWNVKVHKVWVAKKKSGDMEIEANKNLQGVKARSS